MAVSIFSRHYGLATVEEEDPATGTTKVSLAQRLLPAPSFPRRGPGESLPDTLIHTVVGGETMDQLAARYYGREDIWWRIADANPGRFPLDWQSGEQLSVPPIRVATRTPRR